MRTRTVAKIGRTRSGAALVCGSGRGLLPAVLFLDRIGLLEVAAMSAVAVAASTTLLTDEASVKGKTKTVVRCQLDRGHAPCAERRERRQGDASEVRQQHLL